MGFVICKFTIFMTNSVLLQRIKTIYKQNCGRFRSLKKVISDISSYNDIDILNIVATFAGQIKQIS